MIHNRCKRIFFSKLFLIGLGVKIVCLFFFPAFFPRELFIPFFDNAVTNPGINPWSMSPASFFPYGGALFVILAVPKYILFWLLGPIALGTGAIGLFALKLPLLVCDIALYYVLTDLVPERVKSIEKYYWLNPVLFYISYIYGQLDVVSTTLLVLSLYSLIKNHTLFSGLLMGLAIGSKFHVAICVPFIIVYIWNRYYLAEASMRIFKWIFILTGTSLLAFLPVLFADRGGYVTLGSPEVLRLFATQIPLTEGSTLYLGVIFILIVLGRLIISTRISELGLIYGSGFLLSAVLVSSHAAAGWFFWSIPFLSLFFAMYLNIPILLFYGLNFIYFIVFVFWDSFPNNSLLGFSSQSILYSVLQAALIANLYYLWSRALKHEVLVSKRDGSFKIGIAGDSGSGKSVLTNIVSDLFGSENLSVLDGDNYHKWERGDHNWKDFTHLDPSSNKLFDLSNHIKSITLGRPISHNLYDHDLGRFSPPVEIRPSKNLVVQGLHTFYFKNTRKLFDLKIFMAPRPELRKIWKVKRDVELRGAKAEDVLAQLERREHDAIKYINPQAQYADLVLEYIPTKTEINAFQFSGRWIVWNDLNLYPLVEELNSLGFYSDLKVCKEYSDRIELTVTGEPGHNVIQDIALKFLYPLKHLTRSRYPSKWHSGVDGISQLVLLFLIKKNFEQEIS